MVFGRYFLVMVLLHRRLQLKLAPLPARRGRGSCLVSHQAAEVLVLELGVAALLVASQRRQCLRHLRNKRRSKLACRQSASSRAEFKAQCERNALFDRMVSQEEAAEVIAKEILQLDLTVESDVEQEEPALAMSQEILQLCVEPDLEQVGPRAPDRSWRPVAQILSPLLAADSQGSDTPSEEPHGETGTSSLRVQVVAAKIRNVMGMLRRNAIDAVHQRDVAIERAEEMESQLTSVRSVLNALTKYTQDVEKERDDALEETQALSSDLDGVRCSLEQEKRARASEVAKYAAVARGIEGALRRSGVAASAPSGLESFGPGFVTGLSDKVGRLPADMDEEALRAECARRGLDEDGSLAILRIRIRAARALERRQGTAQGLGSNGHSRLKVEV